MVCAGGSERSLLVEMSVVVEVCRGCHPVYPRCPVYVCGVHGRWCPVGPGRGRLRGVGM